MVPIYIKWSSIQGSFWQDKSQYAVEPLSTTCLRWPPCFISMAYGGDRNIIYEQVWGVHERIYVISINNQKRNPSMWLPVHEEYFVDVRLRHWLEHMRHLYWCRVTSWKSENEINSVLPGYNVNKMTPHVYLAEMPKYRLTDSAQATQCFGLRASWYKYIASMEIAQPISVPVRPWR